VPPVPGFLEGLRRACSAAGALLIFDEVITGFRLGAGGAAARYGVRPDLYCFGKVIGGGLPLAAFGGTRGVMERLAPSGPVYQAGTLSGNPLATAAGLAVLALLDDDGYRELAERAGRLARGLAGALGAAGLAVQVPVAGPLVGVFFSGEPIKDYEGARASAATGWYPVLFHRLLERGVAIAPGAYEVLFPSLAHTDDDIRRTVEAAHDAAVAVVAAGPRG
jgi:glutamate-1-semialdehyde 2,1-aminomutase